MAVNTKKLEGKQIELFWDMFRNSVAFDEFFKMGFKNAMSGKDICRRTLMEALDGFQNRYLIKPSLIEPYETAITAKVSAIDIKEQTSERDHLSNIAQASCSSKSGYSSKTSDSRSRFWNNIR